MSDNEKIHLKIQNPIYFYKRTILQNEIFDSIELTYC